MLILLSTVSDQLEGLKAEIEILEQEITRLDASLEEISRVVIASHVT